MANDEPPYLTVGTDVSAKYKGAFCEAKIKKVNRVVKCKVTFKNNQGSFMVTDDLIKGSLRMGADIEAKHPEKNQFLEAVINKLQDYSQYTVVFDDGDETTLRRTSLCLKSGRHFAESPTLDQFPLTNPEHFGTPVIGAGKYKRKRRSTMNSSLDYESSDDDPFPRKLKAIRGKERDPDLGKVVAVDYGDRRKKDSWYPGLIVPHPAQSTIKISKEEHLIRSFKDGKYYQVPKRDTREFQKDNLPKIENNSLKTAVDKAIQYLEKDELPANWEKQLFLGLEHASADEDSLDFESDSSDDEPSEDKDRFVAQLYKFMDERGTPINKAPSVSNKDLNLYKLFKIVHKLGGFNKVTNQNKWKTVYIKMGLPQSNANGPNQIKGAYKRYLQSFEDFYRKLGCTMVNNSRSTRGRHRSDRNFIITRTRDRETASPKGRNSKDVKDKGTPDKKPEEKPRIIDKKEVKREESPKPEEKPKILEKKKIEKVRPEEKDEKQKKEERPRLVRSQSLNKEKKIGSLKEEEKKDSKPEKARTREDARKEKNESPEKKGTRSSLKMEMERKEKEESMKDKKDQSPNKKEKKEEKPLKDVKEDKLKDKKEDKIIKERKLLKEKKLEEKNIKDKVEGSPEKKREDKLLREKRDSSREPKEEKVMKGRKEDSRNQSEERSPPKKKLERLAKEKKEEKVFRPRRENKSPLPDSKKNVDDIDIKSSKEDKIKDFDVKKDDSFKEKPGPKLRDRREDTPFSEDDDMKDAFDDKDSGSLDGFEKKGPGAKCKDDDDEPPNKGKKRSLKSHPSDKDLEDMLTDTDDEIFSSEHDKDLRDLKNCEIELGDRVKVKYGRGRLKKVYDAKVLKIQVDGTEKRYFVHYNGWNNRYDEWVKRSFIVALVNPTKQSKEGGQKPCTQTLKKIERGRPPGPIVPSKPARKNSTSSTNSSLSCSRATRSDKKSLQSSPLSSGLEPKKRRRKKLGLIGLTDTSQDSDSDVDERDLDDDDVGDADIEDNGNTQNDSCFKEELFSDDEEKEKLEDVKRDDIKELEKAISVEEIAEDVKEAFFNSVKSDETKSSVKEEKSEVVEVLQKITANPLPENVKLEVKPVKEDKNESVQSVSSSKSIEKDPEIKLSEKIPESEKKLPPETLVTANVNKGITTPVKAASNISLLPENKTEKVFSPNPPKIAPFLPSEQSTPKKEVTKISSTSSPVPAPENRNLSFSGLHGLLQINAFERNISLSRNLNKDNNVKMEPTKVVLSGIPIKMELKPDREPKKLSSTLFSRSDNKSMPLFGSSSNILNPPRLAEPVKINDKPMLKNSIFGFAMKPIEEKDQTKDLKLLDSAFKFSTIDASKDKPEQKSDNAKTVKSSESFDKKPETSLFKHCVLNPSKFSPVKTENFDSKPDKVKDEFDRLVESTPRKPEMKSSIFPLSFSNVVPKDTFIPDPKFNKVQSLPADNLCCIKPKSSETFDLSKTIPSILERLKKDVVADVKGTESPPPQKEELSFNFLRSSQDTAKSLSRSESSNSLHICEDMSDTNDSNTDSKDLVPENICTPSIMASTASDNAVCSSESLVLQPDVSKSETPVVDSVPSSANISESKDEVKSGLKTSVITVASINSAPALPVVDIDAKKDSPDVSIVEESNIPPETDKEKESSSEKVEEQKVESDDKAIENESKVESNLSLVDKEGKSESLTESNNEESSNSTKFEKPVSNNVNNEKDSLFDDLLKIKSINTNFNQSSVIMWNNETKGNPPVEEKPSVTSEEKDVSVKAEPTLPQKVEPSISTKDSEVPTTANSQDAISTSSDKVVDESIPSNPVSEIKSEPEENENPEESGISVLSKKESKKKRFGKKLKKFGCSEGFENDGIKFKEGKSKSKKRRLDGDDAEKNRDPDVKSKSKKIKKNKNKKRLAKHDDLQGEHKKVDTEDDHKEISDKIKRKEKRKSDKKFFKSGMKGEFSDSKLELKKKKGKKNRDKLGGDKKDFLEKKTKKKKKPHIEENQDTDSDKELSHNKSVDRKKKKEKKKFKTKDSSSSDDAGDKFFKDQKKPLPNLPVNSNVLIRQDSKSDDPDMSFLLCEEKVPASPVGISNMADDTSSSSSIEGNRIDSSMDILPLPNVYPRLNNLESSDTLNKHNIDTSAVLDNTPPTTPSSTESLLSSSPSHERDSFSMNYPESTQSGRDSAEGESDVFRCSSNRTVAKASEEYRAATTLAFAVCKTVSEKPKEEPSHNFLKRQKSEVDEHSPTKRKKKSKRVRRCSESGKSPRHKSSLSRLSKIESCCEDSSGASPAASSSPPYSNISMNFSRSPHRFSCSSEGFSKYNFYVPLHEKDPEKRIALLQDKMAALRKEYMELRAKVIAIDHKRRRARKKIRESGAVNANPSAQSEDGQSCS